MELEESLLYSPESLASAIDEFPNSLSLDHDEYESGYPGFLDDLDDEMKPGDSFNLDNTFKVISSNQFLNGTDIVSDDSVISSSSIITVPPAPTSATLKLKHNSANWNLNDAAIKTSKRAYYFAEEEYHRRNYPVGDSNSKNAIAARDNRIKKKKYVAELEQTVKVLRVDNANLSKEAVESKSRVVNLENEVNYLKSVIANQSTLSAILSSVSQTPGISLSTSFDFETQTKGEDEASNTMPTPSMKQPSSKAKALPKSKAKNFQRGLRSQTNLSSKTLICKGVQNMSAREILLCCKEKEKTKRLNIVNPENSETDSDSDKDVDVDDSIKVISSTHKDYGGGVCLHVKGNKVSLEFCATCNMKSNSDVTLDHSYVRK